MPLWIVVVILGMVEGLTEFIPVSSTGHLIIVDHWLHFQELVGSDKAKAFEVIIQLGAILAIGLIYREKLLKAFFGSLAAGTASSEWKLLMILIIGTVPAAGVGFLSHDIIKDYLFHPITVAAALVVGGIIILIIERLGTVPKVHSTEEITYRQALIVGLAQILSLIPGTSRSGATIVGGLCAGLDRQTATEFSFLLSFPIMCMATAYSILKYRSEFDTAYVFVLGGGFLVAFASAWLVVKWLIHFVQTHSFAAFAYYRIAFGTVLFILFYVKFFQ